MTAKELREILSHMDDEAVIVVPSDYRGRFENPDDITEVARVFGITDKNGDKSVVFSL